MKRDAGGLRPSGAFLLVVLVASIPGPVGGQAPPSAAMAPRNATSPGLLGTVFESLAGNARDSRRWSSLPIDTFFDEGWDEPWVAGPSGQGGAGAPRDAWLNAYDGTFYRHAVATFGFAQDFLDAGVSDSYTSGVTLFTPLNRRVELRWDIPLLTSNRVDSCCDYHVAAGDFGLTPRFLLHETENASHTLDVTFRMPTGDTENLNGVAAVTPRYNAWWNPWKRLVVRGGFGFFTPFGNQSLNELGARTTFLANVAPGYYVTPRDLVPIGAPTTARSWAASLLRSAWVSRSASTPPSASTSPRVSPSPAR